MKILRPIRLALPGVLLTMTACATPPSPEARTEPVRPMVAKAAPGMTGVGFVGPGIEAEAPKVVLKEVNPYQPITIRVVGSGAAPYSKALTPSQRKLLSLRAARLDAFRAIAEQVQGMKLIGNSTVANMIATSDGFRTYVDAYLRGVNIVSNSMQPDGTSEAIAEIVLDKTFYQEFRQAMEKTGSVMKAAQESPATGTELREGAAPPRYNSNYYVSQ